MKHLLLAVSAGAVIAACANGETTDVAEDAAETATAEIEETVEEVAEVVEAALISAQNGAWTPVPQI